MRHCVVLALLAAFLTGCSAMSYRPDSTLLRTAGSYGTAQNELLYYEILGNIALFKCQGPNAVGYHLEISDVSARGSVVPCLSDHGKLTGHGAKWNVHRAGSLKPGTGASPVYARLATERWYCWGSVADVPKNACYVGTYGSHAAWVTEEQLHNLERAASEIRPYLPG